MLKKVSLKMVICFAFALILFTTMKNANAYADETKNVTVNATQTFDAPESVLNSILQAISSNTYQYDDGSYRGILSCTNVSVLSRTVRYQDQYNTIYHYTVNLTYSGTVTKIVTGLTKNVTITNTQTFEAPESVRDDVLHSISLSSYQYDRDYYRGTLNCTNVSLVSSAVYEEHPDIIIYLYTVNVTYSGTVTSY